MDNITHTLVGLTVAEGALRLRANRAASPTQVSRLRVPFWLTSALSNNLPDFDFLYARITSGKLGYLLHHRGHTHTLLFAPLLAALLILALKTWSTKTRNAWSRSDWRWLIGLALLGPLVHMACDFLNSYGVHPLWPFDNHWYYGDTLFIIEPFIWVTLSPLFFLESSSRRGKGAAAAIFATGLGLCFFTGYVPWQLTLLLTLWAFWVFGLLYRLRSSYRVWAAATATIGIVAFFSAASLSVRQQVTELVADQFPESELNDIVVSPLPANPLCWSIFTVETANPYYIARKGTFALFPKVIAAAECPSLTSESRATFMLTPVPGGSRPGLLWRGQFHARLTQFRELRASFCELPAFLRFSRVPAWKVERDGSVIAGDLRFDRSERLEFAELRMNRSNSCPKAVPGWIAPRLNLLTL